MDIELKRALDKEQYGIVAKLADEIWHEHYSSILSPEQIDYMVGKFQSTEEIERSCADGAEYYIACADGAPVGYIGLEFPEKECFLSKLYLKKEFRGLGIGKKMFELAEKLAEEHGETSLMLHVNKYNASSIAVYGKRGFEKRCDLVTDIGEGYVMDDYVMVKKLA